jgi:Galactose mutarotase-like
MIDFHTAASYLYGLPERSARFMIDDNTLFEKPYRLFAVDKFPHTEWDEKQPLYSGIPYLMGHDVESGT